MEKQIQVICPLTEKLCLKDICGWWVIDNDMCSILEIAYDLRTIGGARK